MTNLRPVLLELQTVGNYLESVEPKNPMERIALERRYVSHKLASKLLLQIALDRMKRSVNRAP